MSLLQNHGILVVGVSGVTCGGKTTVAHRLKELFEKHIPCCVIGQDDYFKNEDEIEVDDATGLLKWDVIEAFHMEKMRIDVDLAVCRLSEADVNHRKINAILIIEGILIFDDRKLDSVFDKRYFTTLPFEVAEKRRKCRVYEPPDEPLLFKLHVWPMYMQYRDKILPKHKGIVEVDATQSIDEVFDTVKTDLQKTYRLMDLPHATTHVTF